MRFRALPLAVFAASLAAPASLTSQCPPASRGGNGPGFGDPPGLISPPLRRNPPGGRNPGRGQPGKQPPRIRRPITPRPKVPPKKNPGTPTGVGPQTPVTAPPPVTRPPVRPAPGGPRTGGVAKAPGPVAPSPGHRSNPRGAPIVFTRGRSAKKRLAIDWDVPVYERLVRKGQGTSAAVATVLPFQEALAFVRGDDPRPLLVMRECSLCIGTDFALLSRAMQNDRTMLLTGWFHCVRLPATVTDHKHALYGLFADRTKSHLFFATADGKEVRILPGNQTQAGLWKVMTDILRRSYQTDASKNVRALLGLLNDFDTIDALEAGVRRRLDHAVETYGPRSPQFKKLQAKHRKLQKRRQALLRREAKLRNLRLR